MTASSVPHVSQPLHSHSRMFAQPWAVRLLVKDLHTCCSFTPTPWLLPSSFCDVFWFAAVVTCNTIIFIHLLLTRLFGFLKFFIPPRHHNSILLGMLQKVSRLLSFTLNVQFINTFNLNFNSPASYIHALSEEKQSLWREDTTLASRHFSLHPQPHP